MSYPTPSHLGVQELQKSQFLQRLDISQTTSGTFLLPNDGLHQLEDNQERHYLRLYLQ